MENVTNNHDATLNVAGVEIAPGVTVAIPKAKMDVARNSNGVKQWLLLGIITSDADDEDAGEPDTPPLGIPGLPTPPVMTREQLEVRATELKIEFTKGTRDATLVKKIAEAEAE